MHIATQKLRLSICKTGLLFLFIFCIFIYSATAKETLKVGVLKFGTVNWLMDVITHHKLDEKQNFKLELLKLASKNATSVALLSGAADTIVTDWFWALRERGQGEDFVMFPYSATLGAIMVPNDSQIKTVTDLKGRKIGIAGGPIDKSWLLVRARAQELGVGDLVKTATPVYGAPPLLNQQLIRGNIDAVLNYWPFAARLEGSGFRQIVSVSEVMKALDVDKPPPLIGFVFSQNLTKEKAKAIEGFMKAVGQANKILRESDAEWDRLRPLMKVKTEGQFKALVKRYRAGVISHFGKEDIASAEKLFQLLAKKGGEKLTGKNVKFDPKVFWSHFAH